MNRLIVTALILSFVFLSCKESVIENDLPFVEKMVVRSMLDAGKPVVVNISRTAPMNAVYDSASAVIKDAVVTVTSEDTTYELAYTGGNYSNPGLIAENGLTYELRVKWNGMNASAVTTVPFTAPFQNGKILKGFENGDTTYYIQGLLTPREGAVYGGSWSIINNAAAFLKEDNTVFDLQREKDKDLYGRLTIKTRNIPKDLFQQWSTSFYIRVYAFDEQYYNFFITQNANNAGNNIFSQNGINLRWNVKGDAIGLFIGQSSYVIKIKNQ